MKHIKAIVVNAPIRGTKPFRIVRDVNGRGHRLPEPLPLGSRVFVAIIPVQFTVLAQFNVEVQRG